MDIDIDISPETTPDKLFNIVKASMVEQDTLKKHPVGFYFQNIPTDPITGYSAIPYKVAEDLGFYKIDMLHLNILKQFDSKDEIRNLLKKPPNWKLLHDRSIVENLFHISKHFDIVYQVKPTSVLELADILALIRPNKIKLLDKYLRNRKVVRTELYTKRSKSDLRKSHAIPYALLIVLQMNIIEMNLYENK